MKVQLPANNRACVMHEGEQVMHEGAAACEQQGLPANNRACVMHEGAAACEQQGLCDA
jgi:hypothetical protein